MAMTAEQMAAEIRRNKQSSCLTGTAYLIRFLIKGLEAEFGCQGAETICMPLLDALKATDKVAIGRCVTNRLADALEVKHER